MTLATEVKKFKESKAYYAVTGASDLAAEKLRRAPARLRDLQQRTDARELPGVAVNYAVQAGARAATFIDELAERGRTASQHAEPRPDPAALETPDREPGTTE